MFQRNPGSWNEMCRRDRSVVLVLAAIQFALAAAAWADLARRGRDQILGSKRIWALVICVNFVGPLAYFVFGRRRTPLPPSIDDQENDEDNATDVEESAHGTGGGVIGGEAPDSRVQIQSETITIDVPDSESPVVFPVTTASVRGTVQAAVIGEYGPVGGTAPEGIALRSAVVARWPQARVFERRSTGDRGADPRGYDPFYVELDADGCRHEVQSSEVSALLGEDGRRTSNAIVD
ncbi:MAG: PLD nuclease N-terminal domain-containing protein [Rhodococcus sp. (in: high G+C Gram-positive bacteria)]|jgi:hypothetical protein|uniref:PLD nuclease N-terminal domain-containing protein n=1 Tax=Rhodococcus sp. EPR-157 TaxID=1813677 RepID=UPI0009EF6587